MHHYICDKNYDNENIIFPESFIYFFFLRFEKKIDSFA